MRMRTLLAVGALALTVAVCQAQPSVPARTDEKGTYLGLLFAPLSDVQLKKLPQLPSGQGVRVTQVLAESPASKAEFQRGDIVLAYDGEKVRDCEQFARLIQNDKPNRTVKLTILRDGQEKAVEATLALGPALRIAAPRKGGDHGDVPKAIGKPGGPASVCVAATPLDEGKMKVTIEFYAEGTGKIRTVECQGRSAEIDSEVSKLPQRERDVVREALARIRTLTEPKVPAEKNERKN